MSYHVDYDNMYLVTSSVGTICSGWNQALNDVNTGFRLFCGMDSFKGRAADNIKKYIEEVHGVTIAAITELLANYQTKLFLYKDGYRNGIDNGLHSVLPEEDLEKVFSHFNSILYDFEQEHSRLRVIASSIDDLMWVNTPQSGGVRSSTESILSLTQNLGDSITGYEIQRKNSDFTDINDLITYIERLIDHQLGNSRVSTSDYTSCGFAKMTDCGALLGSINASINYRTGKVEELEAAIAREKVMIEELNEEQADARIEKGIWTALAAVGAIVVGAVAIVATAGAATPAVVAGVFYVAGACSAVYGVSNLSEATQDIYFGLNDDITTIAVNPVRDTVFMGDEKAYEIWGNTSMVVAALAAPVGKAFGAAATANATNTAFSVGRVVATEVGKDVLSGAIGGYAGEFATELTDDERVGAVVGVLAGIGSSVIFGKVDEHFNVSGLYDYDTLAKNSAAQVKAKAVEADPEVTAAMQDLESDSAKLYGLDHRIKGETRMAEKILEDSRINGIGVDEAANNIGDSLRYTFVADDADYTRVVNESLRELESKGYEITKFKNSWSDPVYKGTNVTLTSSDGMKIEVQFHTRNSFYTKETLNHQYYDIARSTTSSRDDIIDAINIMKLNTAQVPVPPGAYDLSLEGVLSK